MRSLTIICSALVLSCPFEALAYTITVFSQSAYNTDVTTMNANLGLPSTFLFEDFDDTSLIPTLQVSSNYAAFPTGFYFEPADIQGQWTLDNALKVIPRDVTTGIVTFQILGGSTHTFGFGVGENQGNAASFRINGLDPAYHLSDYANYMVRGGPTANARNGYVKIEQDLSDPPINSVVLYSAAGDRIFYDHIAFDYVAVPEPSSLMLLGVGAMVWTAFRRRKGNAARHSLFTTPLPETKARDHWNYLSEGRRLGSYGPCRNRLGAP